MGSNSANLSLGRETVIGFGAKLVLAAIGFAGIVIFYRLLGPKTVGEYYTILAGVLLAGQVVNGLSNAIRKRVSEVDTSAAEYLGAGLLAWSIQLPLAVVVGFVVLRVVSEMTPTHVALAVGMLASHTLFALVNRVYAASGYPGKSTWADAIRSLLTFGAQVGFVLYGLAELGLMAGYLLATLVSAAGVWGRLQLVPTVPTRRALSRLYDFARWSIPTTFTEDLYRRVDVLILSALVGSTAVGLYEPALRLTIPATFVSMTVGTSLTVKASGLSSLGRDVFQDLKNAVSYTSVFAIPLFFGAVAIAEPLMRTVYGPSATAGATALMGLALFQLFNSFRIPFDNVVDGIDRPELRLFISALTVAVNVPGAVYLGVRFGLEGVVLATILAEAVRVLAFQAVSYRLFGEFVLPRPLVEQVASGGVMYLVVEFVRSSGLVITGWPWLVAVLAIGGATYFLVLTLISPHFKLTVQNTLAQFTGSPRVRD
jgi:O-antigen/teichoic acid export membrane protein